MFTKFWARSVKVSPTPGFFCQQYEMTFGQLRNGRFSPNLAMTYESWVKRRLWTEIYEKFPFRGHLLPKFQTWKGSNRHLTTGQTGQGMHCRDILFTPLCSPTARKLLRSVNFTLRRTVAEPNFLGFWPIFPIGPTGPLKRTFQ